MNSDHASHSLFERQSIHNQSELQIIKYLFQVKSQIDGERFDELTKMDVI